MKFQQDNIQNNVPNVMYAARYVNDALLQNQIDDLHNFAKEFGFEKAKIGNGNFGDFNGAIRRSNISWLNHEKMPQVVMQHFEKLILQTNEQGYNFDLTGIEPIQYTIYDEADAGEYKWHIDTMMLPDNSIRKLSCSILLSDPSEYEGGNLLLNADGNIMVPKQNKGTAIFFPSWVPHCVTPVTKGTRKALVIWAHGPMFK